MHSWLITMGGELNQTSVLPCGMLCPFERPRGLEGVLQSMDASLRRTLSMSTALKNATDWDRERTRRWSAFLKRQVFKHTVVLSLPAVVWGVVNSWTITTFFLLKGMLYRSVQPNTGPHELNWGDWGVESAVSCKKKSQVAGKQKHPSLWPTLYKNCYYKQS